jgi:hypothetical protein
VKETTMQYVAQAAKAVTGALAAASASAVTAAQDGQISAVEWLTIGGAFVVAFAAVYRVRNVPAE